MDFKDNFSLDRRKSESDKIMQKYPSRIPVIVEKGKSCEFDDIDKKKIFSPPRYEYESIYLCCS